MFSGAHLVAVVIADPQGYERSLVARRIEAVAGDASLREALGARVVLEVVAGGELDTRGLDPSGLMSASQVLGQSVFRGLLSSMWVELAIQGTGCVAG